MKVLSYIVIIFVFCSCTSSCNFYNCFSSYNLYSNYQLVEGRKIPYFKKYHSLYLVFSTDSTGYISGYQYPNDTIMQYFNYKEAESRILVISDSCGNANQIIPLGNDTIVYFNKYLAYFSSERERVYFFYRKRKSEIVPKYTINR